MPNREYIPANDSTFTIHLATILHDAIKRVRGRSYSVKQSVGLYPTAGTSTDYAFSRHMVNPGKEKIYSYTIEWGTRITRHPFIPRTLRCRKSFRKLQLRCSLFPSP